MSSLISKLSSTGQRNLLDDLNYLNTAEIKALCKKYRIPYTIAIENTDGTRRRTSDHDRKGVMLKRIRHFLQTGEILEATCFPNAVVSFRLVPQKLAAEDRLFYGQYDKSNPSMIALLKDLTNGKFKDGAIARILAREFWASGKAPTFLEFAVAWLKATGEHKRPNPEWAFLSDRHDKKAVANWKTLRAQKAKLVLKTISSLRSHKNPKVLKDCTR